MFLSISATGIDKFPPGLGDFVQRFGVPGEKVFWSNAARYLGLTTYGLTTARLRDFYAGDHERFDTLEALVVSDPAKPRGDAQKYPV